MRGSNGNRTQGEDSGTGLDHTINNDDQPLLHGLKENIINKPCGPSADKGHNALDRYLDPTLPFQLVCPTPPQPIRWQNLKAFDAHVQAKFSALYGRLQEELHSRLS